MLPRLSRPVVMPQQNCKLDSFKTNTGQKNVCTVKLTALPPDETQGHSQVLVCPPKNSWEQAHTTNSVPMLIREHDAEGQGQNCHGLYHMQFRGADADCKKQGIAKGLHACKPAGLTVRNPGLRGLKPHSLEQTCRRYANVLQCVHGPDWASLQLLHELLAAALSATLICEVCQQICLLVSSKPSISALLNGFCCCCS